jgi:glycosyltransferase involved in cell wall biosynthesis
MANSASDSSTVSQARRLTASVALASYNGSAFIEAQLDSILAQSELPTEIVVTDDQSSDNTYDLLTEYAARSPVPIRFYRNATRLGFTRNFARAISLCRSDLIFLCDQDDLWLPDKVARMKGVFADPSVFLAYHGALVVTSDNQPLYQLYNKIREEDFLSTKPIDPWHSPYGLTQVFRSSLRGHEDLWERSLNHVWIENEPLSHDQWYYLLAQVHGRIVYVDETLVRYRQHATNAVGASHSGRAASPWGRLRGHLDHDPRLDRLRADAALRRSEILEELRKRIGHTSPNTLEILAQMYRDLSARLERRRSAYCADSAIARAAYLARMVKHGDYGGHPWGFRPPSIARDLLKGVVGGNSNGPAPSPKPTRGRSP